MGEGGGECADLMLDMDEYSIIIIIIIITVI